MLTSVTLKSVLAQAVDAALIVSESGTVLLANDQACHLLEYAPGELDGLPLELLLPVRFRLAHVGHRLRFTDQPRARPMGTNLELFALCKDGSERWVDVSLDPLRRGLETFIIARIHVRAPACRAHYVQ